MEEATPTRTEGFLKGHYRHHGPLTRPYQCLSKTQFGLFVFTGVVFAMHLPKEMLICQNCWPAAQVLQRHRFHPVHNANRAGALDTWLVVMYQDHPRIIGESDWEQKMGEDIWESIHWWEGRPSYLVWADFFVIKLTQQLV